MSKLARDVVNEFRSLDIIEDDFDLFALFLSISDSGEVESTERIEAIIKIEEDHENKECLLHFSSGGEVLKMAKAIKTIETLNPEYSLCSSQEETLDDSWVRLDNPIIGFGENVDLKRFFVVCKA